MEYIEKPSLVLRIKNYLKESWRVLRVTKKPSMMEFKTIVKVSGLGIVVIGLIGFLISMVKQLVF
jgi:protein transport protein SEC61 subunit gamma-like protein